MEINFFNTKFNIKHCKCILHSVKKFNIKSFFFYHKKHYVKVELQETLILLPVQKWHELNKLNCNLNTAKLRLV